MDSHGRAVRAARAPGSSQFLSVFPPGRPFFSWMNDWPLVDAWAQGDEQAFERLVRKYFPIVYSAAARQCGDSHLAQDIAQSVFLIFARKAPALSSDVLLPGWFLRTTRFVVRDALKQMNRRKAKEEMAGSLGDLEAVTGWEPAWRQAMPLVDEALLSLSAGEQACVTARYLEERSFREIGEWLRIPEDTAQKRVSRGLEKMRAYLQRHGVKIGTLAIGGLLGANLASAAGSTLVNVALVSIQAALKNPGTGCLPAQWADLFFKHMAWLRWVRGATGLFATLIFLGAGFWVWTAMNGFGSGPAPFRVTDPQVERLGRDWALVMQRAAAVVQGGAQRPPIPGEDPALGPTRTFVMSETARISTELDGALQAGNERQRFAEFLTVELRETLALDARQQAATYAQLLRYLEQGNAFHDGVQLLCDAKPVFSATLRSALSKAQQQRFNQTYGANSIGLLTFPKLVLASRG